MVFKIAIISWVFVYLGEPGEIFDWYQRLIGKLPERLWKPLGGCAKCLSGQMAFWHFLFMLDDYNFIDHMFLVASTILTTLLIDKLYNYGIKEN